MKDGILVIYSCSLTIKGELRVRGSQLTYCQRVFCGTLFIRFLVVEIKIEI